MEEEDSVLSVPDARVSEAPKKKVRFALDPEGCGHVPWSPARAQKKELLGEGNVLYPIRNNFKDSAYILRAEKEPDDTFGCFGICVLMMCLIVFFLLIWFVMNKVLLLEVENRVGQRFGVGGRRNRFRFVAELS
jgi:hypothetical protein